MRQPNEAAFVAVQAGVTPFIQSGPGQSKTASADAFCQVMARRLYTLIGSITDPSESRGIPFRNEDGKGFINQPPHWAVEIADGGKWLLFLDEFTCCSPAQQSGLLRVMAERYVGDLKLPGPDRLWIMAAANPLDTATNGFEIEPAMANRMAHFTWEMPWDAWDSGMKSGGDFPPPSFPVVPDNWEDRMAGVGAMFTAFRSVRPDCFTLPTDANGNVALDRGQLAKAWPSPRSWHYAMKCRAAGLAAGVSKETLAELMVACVGHVGHEYTTWEDNLDLPDPEYLLEKAINALQAGEEMPWTRPNRPDKAIATLSSVVSAVMANTKDPNRYNAKRWEAAIHVIMVAARTDKDVALSCARSLFKSPTGEAVMPQGATLPREFTDKMLPTLRVVANAR